LTELWREVNYNLVLRRLGHLLSLLAFIAMVNGHLAALQCVAWARMAIDYSRGTSLSVGLAQTFDGQHPCSLCHKIVAAKKNDRPLVRSRLLQDLKYLSAPRFAVKLPSPATFRSWHSRPDPIFLSRYDVPPVPPPRSPLV
jgi:hypothetical protein